MFDSRLAGGKLPQVQDRSNFVFNFPTILVSADVKIEIYRHERSAPDSARMGSQKYDSKQEKWPWCQVTFRLPF